MARLHVGIKAGAAVLALLGAGFGGLYASGNLPWGQGVPQAVDQAALTPSVPADPKPKPVPKPVPKAMAEDTAPAPDEEPSEPPVAARQDPEANPQMAVQDPVPDPEPEPVQAGPEAPSFDVVRVEPDGAALIAGRAPLGSAVDILVDGEVVAQVEANHNGSFASFLTLDPSEGAQVLSLLSRKDGQGTLSEDQVIIAPIQAPVTVLAEGLGAEPTEQAPVQAPEAEPLPVQQERAAAEPEAAKPKPDATATVAETVETQPEEPRQVLALDTPAPLRPLARPEDSAAPAEAGSDTGAPEVAETVQAAEAEVDPKPEVRTEAPAPETAVVEPAPEVAQTVTQQALAADELAADELAADATEADETEKDNQPVSAQISVAPAEVTPSAEVEARNPQITVAGAPSDPAPAEAAAEPMQVATEQSDAEVLKVVEEDLALANAPDEAPKAAPTRSDSQTHVASDIAVLNPVQEPVAQTDASVTAENPAPKAVATGQDDPAPQAEAASNPAAQPEPEPEIAPAAPQVAQALTKPESGPAPDVATSASGLVDPRADPVPAGGAVAVLRAGADGIELLQPANPTRPRAMDRISLDTISYSQTGEVLLAGRARGQSVVRIYLDNTAIADLGADDSGKWKGTLDGVEPGIYTLRLDELSAQGRVTSRLETPFKREAPEVLTAPAPEDPARPAPLIRAVTVQAGDTLWAISRERYGEGTLYVRVFEANRDSIRDPDLIYPGQIFAIPD